MATGLPTILKVNLVTPRGVVAQMHGSREDAVDGREDDRARGERHEQFEESESGALHGVVPVESEVLTSVESRVSCSEPCTL